MRWITNFFTSSIGQKIIMSLTGLFLISFLVVHLIGNLQLVFNHDTAEFPGQQFNEYALFMTTNPLIKTVSYGLYAFILLHAIQGLILWFNNRQSRGNKRYAVKVTREASGGLAWASSNMALLGTIILVFLGIHMGDFWFAMKRGVLEQVAYGDGVMTNDLYAKVYASFKQWWIVLIYIISMIGLAFHLIHGFWSAFQTLGLNHKKYTPLIKGIGWVFSIAIPLAYAIIPLYFFFVLD